MPGGNAKLGLLQSNTLQRHVELRRSRARGTQADAEPDGGCRHRLGNHASEGDQHRLRLQRRRMSRRRRRRYRSRRPAIPEHRARIRAALQAEHRVAVPRRASPPATARRRSATSSSFRTVRTATTRSSRRRRTSVTTSASTGRRTTRSNSARPASTNSSATSWSRRRPRSAHRMRASRSTRRNRNIAGWSWPPTGSSIPAGGSRRPIPISTSSTPNTPKTSATARRLQLQPCRQQDPRHLAERTDGAARL